MEDLQARLAAALAGRYTIAREIGRGGMSVVFVAYDLRLERRVAASLEHPYILKLHDYGEAAGLLFYVMPFVERNSLRQRARERTLPVVDAVRIAHEVQQSSRLGRITPDPLPWSTLMHRSSAVVAFLLLLAAPVLSQTPQSAPGGPPDGQRRFPPPPDHWMTIDSLGQALGLSADQRTKVTPAYTALNGVMKDAAARRQKIREKMQASGFTPGQEMTAEQHAMFDSVRTEMEGLQAEADQWVAAIRNNLTQPQQVKFDALPKPQVIRQRGMAGQPRP
ncbi:MAG TPA: hypothetical protein VGU74_16055 [Gemmatimonadales bacterium]|nr:hypothetical protein [Gemmatimonadales bacterium]